MENVLKENLDIFDITKFIMGFMVVGIHTLGRYGIYPLFRIAVPMFFMISSYLFFSRGGENVSHLKKFFIRNIRLYAFWFIILSPVFLIFGGYLEGNLIFNFFKLIIRFLFGSTFSASWFIIALIIGTTFIFVLRKLNMDIHIILLLTFIIYVLCCLNSNYRNLFADNSAILLVNKIYPGTIYNGFPVSLFWIALGCYFSKRSQGYNKKKTLIGLIISFVLLLCEYSVVTIFQLTVDNDCYFMLIPTCYFLFDILLNFKWKSSSAKIFRKFSTIIYCVHGSIAVIVGELCIKGSNFVDSISKFLIVCILSLLIACLICLLEKIKLFKWIKYSY